MNNTDKVLELARKEATKTTWVPKGVLKQIQEKGIQTIYNLSTEDLERAIELLKESVYLINIIPNKRYDGPLYEKSYELASNIDKFLNQIDEK